MKKYIYSLTLGFISRHFLKMAPPLKIITLIMRQFQKTKKDEKEYIIGNPYHKLKSKKYVSRFSF
ncbi:hypothetical protein [Carp edema virus]|nr:hypothetical protein [Carp edema virus]